MLEDPLPPLPPIKSTGCKRIPKTRRCDSPHDIMCSVLPASVPIVRPVCAQARSYWLPKDDATCLQNIEFRVYSRSLNKVQLTVRRSHLGLHVSTSDLQMVEQTVQPNWPNWGSTVSGAIRSSTANTSEPAYKTVPRWRPAAIAFAALLLIT